MQVGVLYSKERFHLNASVPALCAGTYLVFGTYSEFTYKSKGLFSSVCVTGVKYVKNQLKGLIKVATVDSNVEAAHGNAVLHYLKCHGQPLGSPTLFEGGGYILTSTGQPAQLTARLTSELYSQGFRWFQFNPINPYFSDYALCLELSLTDFGLVQPLGNMLKMWLQKATWMEFFCECGRNRLLWFTDALSTDMM